MTGDPDFDIFKSSYPHAVSRAVTMLGPDAVAELLLQAAAAGVDLGSANGPASAATAVGRESWGRHVTDFGWGAGRALLSALLPWWYQS